MPASSSPRKTGQCTICGTEVALTGDETVESHRAPKQLSGVCFGTGQEPAPTQPLQGSEEVQQWNGVPEEMPDLQGSEEAASRGLQVERYLPAWGWGEGYKSLRMDRHLYGSWVKHDDYTALQAQLQQVEEERDEARHGREDAKRCGSEWQSRATKAEARIQEAVEEFEKQAKRCVKQEDIFRHDVPEYPNWAAGEAGAQEAFQEAADYLRSQSSIEAERERVLEEAARAFERQAKESESSSRSREMQVRAATHREAAAYCRKQAALHPDQSKGER